ncbi:MAG: chemotaxis protein CheD [Deltaproteobacteria bacterium]|nr:chemotaxis protein CheD [Deltaproteobacteria bacterium]
MPETAIRLTQSGVASSGVLKIDQIGAGVGIILYSSQNKIGAGLHILASKSGPKAPKNPIMYANTAIPHVLSQLKEGGVRPPFSVAIAGGAVMLGKQNTASIGPKVVDAVKAALQSEGLQVKLDETGGSMIRCMVLDIDAGKIKIA